MSTKRKKNSKPDTATNVKKEEPAEPAPKEVIYYNSDGVFVPEGAGVEEAATHFAFNASKTWYQANLLIDCFLYDRMVERYKNNRAEEEGRGRYEKGSGRFIPYGPYPDDDITDDFKFCIEESEALPWPAREMLHWVPEEIIKKFGTVAGSFVSDDHLDLTRVAPLSEVVQAFRDLGYEVIYNPSYVRMAQGHSNSPEAERVEQALREMTLRVNIDGKSLEGTIYDLDKELRNLHVEQWAYFPTYPEDTPVRMESKLPTVELYRRLRCRGYLSYLAESVLPDKTKPPQTGVVVLDLSRLKAMQIGDRYDFRIITWNYLDEEPFLKRKARRGPLYWLAYPRELCSF